MESQGWDLYRQPQRGDAPSLFHLMGGWNDSGTVPCIHTEMEVLQNGAFLFSALRAAACCHCPSEPDVPQVTGTQSTWQDNLLSTGEEQA